MAVLVATEQVEKISEVLTRRWLMDGRIVVYEWHTSYLSRGIVDHIAETIFETMKHWLPSRPYLALQIFTQGSVMFTPYSRQRTEEIAKGFPSLRGRVATVTPPTPITRISQGWLDTLQRSQQTNLPHRLFFSESEALEWLRELVR
jgi:hypothetical protein